LDQIAASLIARVNEKHQLGFGLNNATNLDFFDGADASTIGISGAIDADVNNIATAAAADSPGDGSAALSVGDLQDDLNMNGGASTINAFYQEFVAQIGLDARETAASFEERDLLVQHLSSRRAETSGVSLDEEAVQLIEHQRAYQAAARMISVMDELMGDVILSMGR
jgi:flagellar hook-associated protein 1 FlgK